MNNITLRLADKRDAPLVFKFLQKLAEQLGSPDNFKGSVAAIEEYGFGPNPAFQVIIAFERETAVGCILFFEEFSSWRCTPGIYVQDLYVDTRARGLGLGKHLIEAAVESGKRVHATYLRLSVDINNASAIEFYQAVGFKHRHDEQIMMLDIEN